jgi:hypothetical protein
VLVGSTSKCDKDDVVSAIVSSRIEVSVSDGFGQ